MFYLLVEYVSCEQGKNQGTRSAKLPDSGLPDNGLVDLDPRSHVHTAFPCLNVVFVFRFLFLYAYQLQRITIHPNVLILT